MRSIVTLFIMSIDVNSSILLLYLHLFWVQLISTPYKQVSLLLLSIVVLLHAIVQIALYKEFTNTWMSIELLGPK